MIVIAKFHSPEWTNKLNEFFKNFEAFRTLTWMLLPTFYPSQRTKLSKSQSLWWLLPCPVLRRNNLCMTQNQHSNEREASRRGRRGTQVNSHKVYSPNEIDSNARKIIDKNVFRSIPGKQMVQWSEPVGSGWNWIISKMYFGLVSALGLQLP